MKLKKYLNSDYMFTPYIAEIAVVLKNPLRTLILCNLLNKLPAFNAEVKTNKIYGKAYHFKYNQNSIFEKELGVAKTTFKDNIKLLSDYVSYFGDKNNNDSGYNTTYYYLKMEAIRNLFDEGKKLLGKKIKVIQAENKEVYKKPPQSSNKSSTAKTDDLNRINMWQTKLNNNEIDDDEFNRYFQSLKMKLSDNKTSIKYNNELKLWEKI